MNGEPGDARLAAPLDPARAASIAARLRQAGGALGLSPEQLRVMPVQMVYAQQGFLGRLDQSPHAERFVIKGGSSLFTRFRELGRPTRDLDLASTAAPVTLEEVRAWVQDICAVPFGDGLVFPPEQIRVRGSTPESAAHPVVQVTLMALLGRARQPLDLDVSFGNVIHPGKVRAEFPRFVIDEAVTVRIYPLEQVVTEKFAAMLELTVVNTRMKDVHDLWQIAHYHDPERPVGAAGMRAADLAQAMRASFAVRRTPLDNLPFVLSPAFAADRELVQRWERYRAKNGWAALPNFGAVMETVRAFPGPVATALPGLADGRWNPVTLSWE